MTVLTKNSLLPVMCVAYVTQSLDKGTLGTSSIMGWQEHVGAAGQDYALTSTFLWVGIIAGEPIVNQMVRKFPVAKVLGYSMIVWSGVSLPEHGAEDCADHLPARAWSRILPQRQTGLCYPSLAGLFRIVLQSLFGCQ